jgi:hypothetical protein
MARTHDRSTTPSTKTAAIYPDNYSGRLHTQKIDEHITVIIIH